jgi:hypothetical protein
MIAFAFWGIPRAFEQSKDSIVRFMESFQQSYHVYFHTYQINGLYSNIRNNEHNLKIDSTVLLSLNPKEYKIDNQDEIAKELNFKQYYTYPDPWKSKYNSVNNFILATYSKQKVTKMIENSKITYNYIIYIRPDCKFYSFYDKNMLNDIKENIILIPNQTLYGKYLFNDQFAITTNQNYMIYGNLFDTLYEYSKHNCLHSETYISEMLLKNGIYWKCIPLKYEIVRIKPNKKMNLFFV